MRTSAEVASSATPAPPTLISSDPADPANAAAVPMDDDPNLNGSDFAPYGPPGRGYDGMCGMEGSDGPGDCGRCECGPVFRTRCGLLGGLQNHHVWVRSEALFWWTNGGKIPPLLTTSPDSTPLNQSGVLGLPTTTVLLGNQELNTDFRAGGRISFGSWFDPCENFGVQFSYLAIGQDVDRFQRNSSGSPILARPFFNVDRLVNGVQAPSAQDSLVIAYPDTQQGDFATSSTSNFQTAGVLARRVIARGCQYRVEMLGGYRFQRLSESLDITDALISQGATVGVFDDFHTRNDFQGGEVGCMAQSRWRRWSFEATLKCGLGNTHTRVDIDGSTATTVGSQTTTSPGGLLALPSNMGQHDSDRFSVVPELGVTLGFDLTRHLRATAGYTFLYWSNVARPGDQIDLNVDPAGFPPGVPTEKPQFALRTSDFWAQGINLGLDYRF